MLFYFIFPWILTDIGIGIRLKHHHMAPTEEDLLCILSLWVVARSPNCGSTQVLMVILISGVVVMLCCLAEGQVRPPNFRQDATTTTTTRFTKFVLFSFTKHSENFASAFLVFFTTNWKINFFWNILLVTVSRDFWVLVFATNSFSWSYIGTLGQFRFLLNICGGIRIQTC